MPRTAFSMTIDGEWMYIAAYLALKPGPAPAGASIQRRLHQAKLFDGARVKAEKVARDYEARIAEILCEIIATDTGTAVIGRIEEALAGGLSLRIEPHMEAKKVERDFDGTETKSFDPKAGADAHGIVHPWNAPIRQPVNASAKGEGAIAWRLRRNARRPGSSVVEFTPAHWSRDRPDKLMYDLGIGTRGGNFVGSLPDEVLLHELVHALRDLTGLATKSGMRTYNPVPKQPGWDNFEEFFAILVSNIYHSERGRKHIRSNHDSGWSSKTDEEWLDIARNRSHVRRFRREQPELFNDLRDVPAAWNPLRGFSPATEARQRRIRRRIARATV